MSSRAYWEADSMAPERIHPPTRSTTLEKKVKELEYRQAV
jgi:hypothetical protein